MRASWIGWTLTSLLAVPTLSAPSDTQTNVGKKLEKRAKGIDSTLPSVFNGLDVPPLFQLTEENFEEATKDGIW